MNATQPYLSPEPVTQLLCQCCDKPLGWKLDAGHPHGRVICDECKASTSWAPPIETTVTPADPQVPSTA